MHHFLDQRRRRLQWRISLNQCETGYLLRGLAFLIVSGLSWAAPPALERLSEPSAALPREAFPDQRWALRSGEVVVFTGGTTAVLEQQTGWLETLITSSTATDDKDGAKKAKAPKFRHLSWEGDTVYEQWRDQNFGSWKEQCEAVGATTIVTWFGQMEALDQTKSVAEFEAAYSKLLVEFKAITPRLAVMAPLPFMELPPTATNRPPKLLACRDRLSEITQAAERAAKAHGAVFISLQALQGSDVSENGVHPTPLGQRQLADQVAKAMGLQVTVSDGLAPLHAAIQKKNRLWFDCWRTMNWAFAYSDRTTQRFGQGINGHPPLTEELKHYKTLISEADDAIWKISRGEKAAPPESPAAMPPASPQSDPAEELASFTLRDGWAVNLFASEANGLIKPLAMRTDERGRLWACCAPTYPQLTPGVPAADFILVCEDTDSDGQADRFHKYAEGLTMPMGLEFGHGGVYVCESTQLVHLRDSDGDGRADQRRVILSGFGTGDSHQLINSVRWGPDGCLWFTQGLHIFSRIETPHGIVHFDRAGLWRFDPHTHRLNGFFGGAAAGANCWGVTFDDWGQVFHSAADNRPAFFTTPGLGSLSTPPPYEKIGSLAVSSVKGMELEYLSGSHLPKELQGALAKPVYFANQVMLWNLKEEGAGFKTEELGPLISSSSTAFRPVQISVGGDGALYVCDWFNAVIGHYQASYRDPARDKTHGRIWRLRAKDRPLAAVPPLHSMDSTALRLSLHSPERWVRDHARRLLSERRESGQHPPIAVELNNREESAERVFEQLALAAQSGILSADHLRFGLNFPDPRVQAFAWRLWSQRPDLQAELGSLTPLASPTTHMPAPRVTLEWIVAQSWRGAAVGPNDYALLGELLLRPIDRWTRYALDITIRTLAPHWRAAIASGKPTFPDAKSIIVAYGLAGIKDADAELRGLLKGAPPLSDTHVSILGLLAANGAPDQLVAAVEVSLQVPADKLNPLLSGLLAAAQQDKPYPASAPWSVEDFLASMLSRAAQPAQVWHLAAAWKALPQGHDPWATIRAPLLSRAHRAAAMEAGLASRPDPPGGKKALLVNLAQPGPWLPPDASSLHKPEAPTYEALKRLILLDPLSAIDVITARLQLTSSEERESVIQLVCSRAETAKHFKTRLEKQPPPPDVALLWLASAQAIGITATDIVMPLQAAAHSPSTPLPYSAEQVAQIVSQMEADLQSPEKQQRIESGRRIFASAQASCVSCHHTEASTPAGPDRVGPSLSSIGRGLTPSLIVEAVLWPQRQVKEGYFLTTITTRGGETVVGYGLQETPEKLLLTAPGTRQPIEVDTTTIATRTATGSLMPETAWALSPDQRRDLFAYLRSLGR